MTMPTLDFSKSNGLIPCIVQDAQTHKVLMLGYMNEEALHQTEREKKVTFFSRTKNRLWTKGETSGNFLHVVSIQADCDRDTLLIRANPTGAVCHEGYDTCFQETNTSADLSFLENIIRDRFEHPKENSYVNKLQQTGINKVAQKVGEEAVELIIEAKDNNRDLFLNEAADLLFHFLVLLKMKDASLQDVVQVLKQREKK